MHTTQRYLLALCRGRRRQKIHFTLDPSRKPGWAHRSRRLPIKIRFEDVWRVMRIDKTDSVAPPTRFGSSRRLGRIVRLRRSNGVTMSDRISRIMLHSTNDYIRSRRRPLCGTSSSTSCWRRLATFRYGKY